MTTSPSQTAAPGGSGQHTRGRRWKAWSDANITCEGVHGHVAECSTAERAREIVDALNAHDELVERLTNLIKWADANRPKDSGCLRAGHDIGPLLRASETLAAIRATGSAS